MTVAPLTAEDWPAAARIFEAGIAAGNATFEAQAPTCEQFFAARDGCPAIVARGRGGDVLGWAALSRTSARPVYRGVGAVSIYVDPAVARRGVGSLLLSEPRRGLRAGRLLDGRGGDLPGEHRVDRPARRLGFRLVGVRRRIGQMPDGRWRDVLLYERRSLTGGAPLSAGRRGVPAHA